MKKTFSIDSNSENMRLDRWIRHNICRLPQSLIEKSIRKGKIKINNKKEKSSYKLKKKDFINLYNFDYSSNKIKQKSYSYIPTKVELSKTSSFIIESNENFVVLNKPSNIPVQPGTKSKRNILDLLKQTKEFINSQPYIVHRIDKETTGVLIVAKNRKYAQLFTSLFRVRKIRKIYLAIVVGEIEKHKGTLTDTLYHYEGTKKIFTKAVTNFKVLNSNVNYSLLELNPITGRKHQLRKQLLAYGYPVLGDKKYRNLSHYKDKKNSLMLHAYKINFSINNLRYEFKAPPPQDFIKSINEKRLKISL